MRIRTQIFLGVLFVVSIGFASLMYWITEDLEPEYRKATEEPLVDSAWVLASLAAQMTNDGIIDTEAFKRALGDAYSSTFTARIYDFEKAGVDFRVYITDEHGTVLFHSYDKSEVGRDYSQWNDVLKTLRGQYGARSTRDNPEDETSSVMYVAAPIKVEGNTIGVLSVGKPTYASARFINRAKRKIVGSGTAVLLSVILVVALISALMSRPIHQLTDYANRVRDGERTPLPQLKGAEVRELGQAFEQMKEALEGRKYIENYVQTLTHEVKSPLSAIHGAAELLREKMPEEQRNRFVQNIISETQRIETVVEKLLLLSTLEARKELENLSTFSIGELAQEIEETFDSRLVLKDLTLDISGDRSCTLEGDRFLIRHAVSNLLYNAVDFSPPGETINLNITCDTGKVRITVGDSGKGIPEYALPKVFDRFYSLSRPDTGRKSSGLGLSLVREVATLHGGSAEVVNNPDGGAIASITLPLNQA